MADHPISRAPMILRAGDAVCEIWPRAGGSIGGWTVSGQDMLRRADPGAIMHPLPLGMASFPLIPYSNRIGRGRFDWAGNTVRLEPNFPPEPHAIHGTGWTSGWDAETLGTETIALRHRHSADARWPWSFEAEQQITLSSDALSLQLIARNLSDVPAPLAFGHHPYFDSAGATLSFHASQVWRTGSDGLPSHSEVPHDGFDFANGEPVQGRILDNGFAQWDGMATIRWDDRPLQLKIHADMSAAVVYVPEGGDYFCFEPVPHIINALNLPGHSPQMPVIEPGASFDAHIDFEVRAS